MHSGLPWTCCTARGRRPNWTPENGETVLLSGCVVDPPVLGRERERFLLELGPRAIASVSMMVKPDAPPLNYGQRVEVEAKIRLPHNYQNPGAFDYAAYLSRQNIYWYASIPRDGAVRIMPGRCGSRMAGVVFGLRTAALDRIERLYAGNDYATAMMEAILIGQSAKLEKVWTDHFRRTGTYHAMVISGLHVTVLAGVLLFLLRICMAGELTALVIACAAAWVYAAVSGWSAPVNRAAGGFTLYLIGRFFFRRGRALNLLAVIAFLYVCFDPGQLFDPSFQLSFLAVAALGAVAAPILERTSGLYTRSTRFIHDRNYDLHIPREAASARIEMRLIAETVALWARVPERITLAVLAWWFRLILWMYEMFLISAVIQFALALAMILYFHRVSLTGFDCEPNYRAADDGGRSDRFRRNLHGLALAGDRRRMAPCRIGVGRGLPRQVRAPMANAGSAVMAVRGVRRRLDPARLDSAARRGCPMGGRHRFGRAAGDHDLVAVCSAIAQGTTRTDRGGRRAGRCTTGRVPDGSTMLVDRRRNPDVRARPETPYRHR